MADQVQRNRLGDLIFWGVAVSVIGGLIYLLLPTVGNRVSTRMLCSNNLKYIALALHNYYDACDTFPPAYTVDPDGTPLHSWRTLLLPYLEHKQLYEKIRLDEPWNSAHNRIFADSVLAIYTCPKTKQGLAYLAVVTPGAIFEGADPRSISAIRDGLSNTIAIIEVVPRPNSWMQPAIDFDQHELEQVLANGLASEHLGGTQAALADGSVRFVGKTIPAETLKALLTRNGGEEIRDVGDW